MEPPPPPKADIEVKIAQNPNPSPIVDPKAADQGQKKGGGNASIEMKGSDPTAAQPPVRTGSKKNVHWSPELVSGSQEPDHSSYPAGSNPYIARSPPETTDASLKG